MVAIWYVSVIIIGIPLIHMCLKKLDKEINNDEKEIYY